MTSPFESMGITPRSAPPPGFDPADMVARGTSDPVQRIISVALDVSGRCNLACRYCVEAAALPKRKPMKADVLRDALGLLEVQEPVGPRPSVRIGSGEPMLAMPLLRRLRALLEKGPSPVDVFVTTNGTLIDESMADWLAVTGWYIKISLDGPQQIHDAWRCERGGKGTFERVSRAVRLMIERCPDRTSVAAVLCRGADPSSVFWSIASLGVGRIELLPVASRTVAGERDISPSQEDVTAYVRFVNDYARRVACDGPESQPTLVRFEESVRKLMGYGNAPVPCGAGRSFVCVGSDRTIYPCFRFAGVKKYSIGDLDRGLDIAAADSFRAGAGRSTHQRVRCSACWGASLCGGPCFAVAEFISEDTGVTEDPHCLYKLADVRAAFWFVGFSRKHNVENLLSYLPVKPDLP